VTTRIYSPEGTTGAVAATRAAAPETLAGLRIGVLDNGKPGTDVLLGRLASTLAERAGAVFAGARRKGSAATPCEEALLGEILGDADLVLTGTAD
jgi:hypothetical protein